jgi:hypothetical protein
VLIVDRLPELICAGSLSVIIKFKLFLFERQYSHQRIIFSDVVMVKRSQYMNAYQVIAYDADSFVDFFQ